MTSSSKVSPRRLASWVYRELGGPRASLPSRLRRGLLRRVRQAWLHVSDPPVAFSWPDVGVLLLPLSHELGVITRAYPEYGLNLGRLANALAGRYPGFTAIDIGANVGDSAILLRRFGAGAVLAIEGAEEFGAFLRANSADDSNVEIAAEFVRVTAGAPVVRISARGSSRLAPRPDGAAAPGRSLPAILQDHPRFASPRLVKLDTDGLDLEILRESSGWLAAVKPVLFFEYLPFFFRRHSTEPEVVFRALAEAGYTTMLVYDNVGRFLCLLGLGADDELRGDLLKYFERDNDDVYADIALFASADEPLARQLALLERNRG